MVAVLAMLNGRVYAAHLERCWVKPLVAAATEVLACHDPLALLKLGCPRDEYEPEAVRIVGAVLGFQSDEALWASSPRPWPEASSAEVRAACAQAFAQLFGEPYADSITEAIAVHMTRALRGAAALTA
jgi:hypothetical protein